MQVDENKYLESAKAALDNAIKEVAREEYARLSKGLLPIKVSKCGEYALKELDKLKFGAVFKYNKWGASFYISWHQPGRINLAYSMIADMVGDKSDVLTNAGKLHVVDFGCGALAMQFGIDLNAADDRRNTY